MILRNYYYYCYYHYYYYYYYYFTWQCFLAIKGRSQFTINENNYNYRTYRDLAL